MSEVTIPYLPLTADESISLTMATNEQKFQLLDKLMGDEVALEQIPEAWRDHPLKAWCWFVLYTNREILDWDGVEGSEYPLTHWGIDLGFSTTEVRRFLWVMA